MRNTLFNRAFGGFDFIKDDYMNQVGIYQREYDKSVEEMLKEFDKTRKEIIKEEEDYFVDYKISLTRKELEKTSKKKFNILSLIRKVFKWTSRK